MRHVSDHAHPAGSSNEAADFDVQALRRGDAKAFEALVRSETPRLFRMIVRMIRDEDDAKSVLQETFLQAYQRIDTFRGDSKVTTWLYAIGLNQARAYLRKAKRYATLEEQDLERLQPNFRKGRYDPQPVAWDPGKITELNERQRLVHAAIDQLPPDYKQVVLLRDIEGLSTDEAAQIVGVSPGALRVRLHRARQALRTLLERHMR
ncbi:MAG: sigma-70 family RNA polymerase sigma factor [Bacteroidota bacterium]